MSCNRNDENPVPLTNENIQDTFKAVEAIAISLFAAIDSLPQPAKRAVLSHVNDGKSGFSMYRVTSRAPYFDLMQGAEAMSPQAAEDVKLKKDNMLLQAQHAMEKALAATFRHGAIQNRIVDEVLWSVLLRSASVASPHAGDSHVQTRVDQTTVAVMSVLYNHKPKVSFFVLPTDKHSLLYKCVRVSQHVYGPATIEMIASRYDQCFREVDLLDRKAVDLFEQRYHHNILDGYSVITCRTW
jgi:hypothetical protein